MTVTRRLKQGPEVPGTPLAPSGDPGNTSSTKATFHLGTRFGEDGMVASSAAYGLTEFRSFNMSDLSVLYAVYSPSFWMNFLSHVLY